MQDAIEIKLAYFESGFASFARATIRGMNEIVPYRRELSERQAEFVRAFVASGDAHQSALAAGYAPATARNAGTQLLESPAVALAIVQVARLRLARGAPLAINNT
jgi:Terminase small subunit